MIFFVKLLSIIVCVGAVKGRKRDPLETHVEAISADTSFAHRQLQVLYAAEQQLYKAVITLTILAAIKAAREPIDLTMYRLKGDQSEDLERLSRLIYTRTRGGRVCSTTDTSDECYAAVSDELH